jgi:hypothetical protein
LTAASIFVNDVTDCIAPIVNDIPIAPHTQPRLSKSRIMSGLQCHKRLWLETYHRELIAYGEASQAAFAQGNFFGELARDLIAQTEQKSSYLVAATEDPQQALKDTATALNTHEILFEPAFRYEGVFVRTDALIRHDRGDDEPVYTMVEVKAASNVKPQYIRDSAIQVWVLRGTGLNITRVELGYVNTNFTYDGHTYAGLLKRHNITAQVEAELIRIQGWIDEQREMLRSPTAPDIAMGRHCNSPYACPFLKHCADSKPASTVSEPEFSVMLLPGVKGKVLAKRLQEAGHTDLLKVPSNELDNFKFVQDVYRSGQPWHDVSLAHDTLMAHPKPWAYLDFETISPAVPLWAGMQPFSHWAFQWSVHLEHLSNNHHQNSTSIQHTHHDFLDLTGNNPSLHCAETLLSTLHHAKTVWAYNAAFERQIILRLAQFLPQHAAALQQLAAKLQDLIPIVQACYYHPAMQGSYSLKSVLPAIAPELDYQHLEGVKNGNAAQSAFFEAISTECSPERHAELNTQLRRYCQLDTWAMVILVERLLNPPLNSH